MPYRPAIDGLRALAVAAVVLFHADVAWLPAGFLGVDVFFVISGYLITSLLISDAATGTLSLPRFWRRRARRLLPALFAAIAGTTIATLLVAPDAAGRLQADAPAAFGYVSNWWQIVREDSYFDVFARPPLLRHLWTLAVEEQFYVLLPLVLVPVLRRRSARRSTVAGGAVAVGAASAVLMAMLWEPGSDPSRVYMGTDTHAMGLFAGVALAVLWHPTLLRSDVRPGARVLLDGAGVAAIGGLLAAMALFHERDAALYRGGFAVVAVLSAVAVAVAAHPASRLAFLLGSRLPRWVGTRSYALYLWHWPVIALTRPGIDVPLRGAPLLGLRVVVSMALAEASWRLVEQPFRTGSAWRALAGVRTSTRARMAFAGTAAYVAMFAGLSLVATSTTPELLAGAAGESTATTLVRLAGTTTTVPTPTTATSASSTSAPPATSLASATQPAASPAAPTTVAPPAPPPDGNVLAVGDSVMLAARAALSESSGGRIAVDAAVARQVDDGLDVLQRYRDAGHFATVGALVIHFGTNGAFSAPQFERLGQIVEGVPRVVVLNVRVPRDWEWESNVTIGDGVPRHPAMRLVDWYRPAGEPGVLGDDWVHPTPHGARIYAQLVLDQLAPPPSPPPPPPPPSTTTTTAPPPAPPAPPG